MRCRMHFYKRGGCDRNNQALRNCMLPSITGIQSVIKKPVIQANYFEIKPSTMHMIQASVRGSLLNKDSNAHTKFFLEICNTFKYNGVTDDAIRLKLFCFSLSNKAKNWLNSLPSDSVTTWNDLAQKYWLSSNHQQRQLRCPLKLITLLNIEGRHCMNMGKIQDIVTKVASSQTTKMDTSSIFL